MPLHHVDSICLKCGQLHLVSNGLVIERGPTESGSLAGLAGAALDALAGVLGHASVTATQVYAQLVDRMTENLARYLEAVMGGWSLPK